MGLYCCNCFVCLYTVGLLDFVGLLVRCFKYHVIVGWFVMVVGCVLLGLYLCSWLFVLVYYLWFTVWVGLTCEFGCFYGLICLVIGLGDFFGFGVLCRVLFCLLGFWVETVWVFVVV